MIVTVLLGPSRKDRNTEMQLFIHMIESTCARCIYMIEHMHVSKYSSSESLESLQIMEKIKA